MKRINRHDKLAHLLRVLVVQITVFLTACSSVPNVPVPQEISRFSVRYDEAFASRPDIIAVEELHEISVEQRQHFLDYFHDKKREKIATHERLAAYLENFTDKFLYENETYTAEQTLALSRGNCMSLATLTTALADLADVEVGYQLADSTPVFSFRDSVVVKGVHVRTKLYDPSFVPEEGRFYLRRPGLKIDYFPSGAERFISNVSKNNYVSRYYLNLAAVAIREKNYSRAYWLAIESLDIYPLNSDAYNTLGIIYRRSGEVEKAEEVYRYGIENFPDKLTLLKNYRTLLSLQSRGDEAKLISEKIEKIDDPNPFPFIYAGKEAYDAGRYSEAIKFYLRALNMAPYIHEARIALAQSYYRTGKISAAEKQLQAAIESAQEPIDRKLYQAKLMSLTVETD